MPALKSTIRVELFFLGPLKRSYPRIKMRGLPPTIFHFWVEKVKTVTA